MRVFLNGSLTTMKELTSSPIFPKLHPIALKVLVYMLGQIPALEDTKWWVPKDLASPCGLSVDDVKWALEYLAGGPTPPTDL